ncbi:uncharacterized protein LOC143450293 [Clavelina lepadiformis]|uniref:uncharacterized protein LOC143450293 n=1 Tax=Clavelina lepadiformis TaxID=159417 RepID=UPI0040436E63
MSAERMEADDSSNENKNDSSVSEIPMEAQDNSSENDIKIATLKSAFTWSTCKNSSNFVNQSSNSEKQPQPCNLPVKSVFANSNGNSLKERQNLLGNSSKSMWSIRSSVPLKSGNHCSVTYARRRRSHENCVNDVNERRPVENEASSRNPLTISGKSMSSAFVGKSSARSDDQQRESNVLKRCNSAPILNDIEIAESTSGWDRQMSSSTGRIRRFSATVVSGNMSPATGLSRSRLRLHQLQSEESFEGIQSKEAAHEREVHTTIQISSNCGDLSIRDRRISYESYMTSPRSQLPSPQAPSAKAHFPTPASSLSGIKLAHNRAIDFGTSVHSSGPHSPTHPHHPTSHVPLSSGIPSPLTLSTSPYHFSLSPLPPSPTRAFIGPGKQCFSPSMLNPVSLARATSRSPSPSPTRHHPFATRRRSQSPCIMKPSAFAPTKRKYDSDSEGSCSPKRAFIQSGNSGLPHGGSGDASMSNQSLNNTPLHHRTIIHRSHSLSSSSVDSSDLYVSPSPPHQGTTFPNHHNNHQVNGFNHPLHHSSTLMHTNNGSQTMLDQVTRCSSPASSTCSSSSLEGIRDLHSLTSPQQQMIAAKKL